jgi:putative ABC transport system permease protein
MLGAYGAVRRALTLPPAEAMRPEPPAIYHAGLLERLGIRRLTSAPARMILRTLIRRPFRALLGVVGISFAVAILLVGRFFVDSMNQIADVQFRLVQREDVTVSFHDPQPGRARHEIARLPGVLLSESFRTIPARLRFEHRHRRVGVFGLPEGTELRGLIDEDLKRVKVPGEGVVLTERLAEILGVTPGDRLTVEVLEGARPVREVAVAGLVNELIGLSAYMNVEALNRFMREGRTVSGALLSIDPIGASGLYSLLKSVPAVGGVGIQEAERASFEETIAQSMGIFTTVLVIFSCVIACAVIYNAARIALSERGRELASLRVLGFTRREVSIMLLGEQTILTLLAIPIGCLIGYWISALIASYYQWELFRLPLVISDDTYAFSMIVVLAASVVSGLVVRRRIDRLDLVAVLKTRE